MKMTIDEVIKEIEEEYAEFLKETRLNNQSRMEEERKNIPSFDKVCTANEMTLDILRKYQKIEQMLKMAESEQEPTPKTCKTCRNFGSHNGVCDICTNF